MAYKTITIQGDGVRQEAVANAAITPGHLIELMSTSKVRVHASAGQPCLPMFAVENDLEGKEIGDAYAAADMVQYCHFGSGDVVYALIANGQDIAVGDKLESAGTGALRKYAASSAGAVEYPLSIVGVALDAVDMSGSSAVDPSGRCRVRIR